jgi:hypothetical protein
MDYALRIIVEKVAISSQEVIKRNTITSYAVQCPTSIVELGLRPAEQIALLEKVQNIVLAEQSLLLAPGRPGCPTCGNALHIGPMALKLRPDLIESVERCLCCRFNVWSWQFVAKMDTKAV